jgi:hypothetical protein
MDHLTSDFRQWLKNETTLMHTRMWDFELIRINDLVAKKKYVDINIPWRPHSYPPASHCLFNLQNPVQEIKGRKLGLHSYGTIQEPGLFGFHFNRLSFVI